MGIKHSGKTPRVTAKSFAEKIGVDVSVVRNFQKLSKSYNDAARKWAARYGYSGQMWRSWSITAISMSHGAKTPAEAFQYAYEELSQRMLEGVSKTLNVKMEQYSANVMQAIASSDEFLLDSRLQSLFDKWQAGKLSAAKIFRATGGIPLRALYTSKSGVAGQIEIDFNPLIDAFEDAGLL